MVEHPGQRLAVRSPQVARSTSATQSRPLSADDIQKAKMRAQFMQNKHGKTITCPDEKIKSEGENKCTASHASFAPLVSKSNVQTELEEQRKLDDSLSKLANPHETSPVNLEEPPWKKYKRIQIPWRTPPGTFFFSSCSDLSFSVFLVAVYNLSDKLLLCLGSLSEVEKVEIC